jgi:hypothetical protein
MKKIVLILALALSITMLIGCDRNTPSLSTGTTTAKNTQNQTSQPTLHKTTMAATFPVTGGSVWNDLYITELTKHIGKNTAAFNIYDLDGNGIPELLLSVDNYHGANAEIFTVADGKLVDLGRFGAYGDFDYDPINKYIKDSFFNQGVGVTTFYNILDNKIVSLIHFDYNGFNPSDVKYAVDDISVSKEVFDAEYAKYNTNNFSSIARKYVITAENITKILSAPG